MRKRTLIYFVVLLIFLIMILAYLIKTDVVEGSLSPSVEDGSIIPFGFYADGQNSLTYETNIHGKGSGWKFFYNGQNEDIEYYVLESDLQDSFFNVYSRKDGTDEFTPLNNAGTVYRDGSSNLKLPGMQGHNPSLISSYISENTLELRYNENDVNSNSKIYRLTINGKTLILEFESNQDKTSYLKNYAGFRTGSSLSGLNKKTIDIDFMGFSPVNLLYSSSNNPLYFYSLYPDYTFSNSQEYLQEGDCSNSISSSPCRLDSYYHGRTLNTKILPLRERYYLTVSSNVDDLIVKLNNPTSPYIYQLKDKLYLDHYSFGDLKSLGNDSIVLEWTADESGRLAIFVDFKRTVEEMCWSHRISGNILSEGLNFEIMQNANSLTYLRTFPSLDYKNHSYQIDASVSEGDKLYFLFSGKDNRCENVSVDISFELNGRLKKYSEDYSTVQGTNGWRYLMRVNNQNVPLQYDSVLDRWQSDEYFGYISMEKVSPISNKYFYHMNNLINNLYYLGVEKLVFVPKISYSGHSSYLNEIPSSFPMGGDIAMGILSNNLHNRGNLFGLYFMRFWFSPSYPLTGPDYSSIYNDQLLRDVNGNLITSVGQIHPELGYCNGNLDICSPTGTVGVIPLPLSCPTVYPFGNECLV